MKAIPAEIRRRRRTVIDAAMIFIIILLVVQIWLLTATLESYLAGNRHAALPGVIVSWVLFVACFGLYRLARRLDKSPEEGDSMP